MRRLITLGLLLFLGSANATSILVVGSSTDLINAAAANISATVSVGSITGTTDLSSFDMVFFRNGSGTIAGDAAANLASWTNSGGGLYVELGAAFPGLDYSWVPTAGVTSTAGNDPSSDQVTIADPGSDIVQFTNNDELDSWGYTGHGDFLTYGGLDVIITNDATGRAVTLAGDQGLGRVIYNNIDAACCGLTSSHGGPAAVNLLTGSFAYLAGATIVPVPAAVWLFGSALAGLGFLRRK